MRPRFEIGGGAHTKGSVSKKAETDESKNDAHLIVGILSPMRLLAQKTRQGVVLSVATSVILLSIPSLGPRKSTWNVCVYRRIPTV